MSGVSHGLGLVRVVAYCSYVFGVCRVLVCHWVDVRSFIVPGYTLMVILIDGLVSGVFHGLGLGLGLGLSHTVEL